METTMKTYSEGQRLVCITGSIHHGITGTVYATRIVKNRSMPDYQRVELACDPNSAGVTLLDACADCFEPIK